MACPKSLLKARWETDSSSNSSLTLPLSPRVQEGDVCALLPALDPREVQQGLQGVASGCVELEIQQAGI